VPWTVSERIVVVGASLAGLRAMEAMRQRGHTGEIIAVSAEPHRPYDRPPLSKQFLKGEWQEDRLSLRRQGFEELDVDWRLGVSAQSLDPGGRCVVLDDGSRLSFGGLLIATGARPRPLPTAAGLAGVHMLRSLDDARALRGDLEAGGRLVVVGAGFIGMEVAASARERGVDVVVVEALEAPLVRGLGRTLGDLVAARHRDHGVDVRCGIGVSGFDGAGRVESVKLSDGSSLEATTVLVGIGVVPEVDWLAGSGLDIENGVLCDATGATALEHVVAAGDAARWMDPRSGRAVRHEHWTSAVEQAGVAAARLVGGPGGAEPLEQIAYVWSDQFDMRIAIAGEAASGDTMHVAHGRLDDDRFIALMGKAGRLVGAVSFRRPRQLNLCRELLERGASFDEAVRLVD
jgi:NADPH-dependent 2,4-dienoyl-CoA reductase/sulfur reductase-like enzyme